MQVERDQLAPDSLYQKVNKERKRWRKSSTKVNIALVLPHEYASDSFRNFSKERCGKNKGKSSTINFVSPARHSWNFFLILLVWFLRSTDTCSIWSPRAWYSRFATFLLTLGFTEAKSDTSLFIYRRGDETAYLLFYVDDIVLTAFSQPLLQSVISSLQPEFAMKDLG